MVTTTESKTDGKEEVQKEEGQKVNPIAKEATAPKAKPQPSKIKESQEKVAERKESDTARKPNLSDMMKSMRKQTKSKILESGPTVRGRTTNKPSSFPDPTFKAK